MPSTWFTDFTYADSGNVLRCTVGGVHAKGTTLRTLLGLRSTNFTVSTTETSITFETTGYGHAVGMSQYGAKGMAEEGSTCEEILTHYYTGTEISQITE
jgi:stage II sporulation protein D